MSILSKIFLSLVAAALLGAAGVGLVAMKFLSEAPSSVSETAVFEVRPGESFRAVARRLEEQKLVSDAFKFRLLARVLGSTGKIRVGEYAIRRDANPRDVLAIVTSGQSILYSVTVTEGSNLFEIGDALQRQGIIKREDYMALVTDKNFVQEMIGEPRESLEGYLFPETYHITKFTSARALIKSMVERFKENFAKVQVPADFGMDRHQIVTLASIIEKETGAPEERGVISSVFHNRLRKKMRLQTDPTVIYGVWEKAGTWNRNISRADLTTPTRFNTYTLDGLPFGPISNPGLESLRAAVAPAKSEFLFFVSRNDGTHIFSKDYSQHQKAVTQFQMDRKARQGRSWRELKNRTSTPATVKSAPDAR